MAHEWVKMLANFQVDWLKSISVISRIIFGITEAKPPRALYSFAEYTKEKADSNK